MFDAPNEIYILTTLSTHMFDEEFIAHQHDKYHLKFSCIFFLNFRVQHSYPVHFLADPLNPRVN